MNLLLNNLPIKINLHIMNLFIFNYQHFDKIIITLYLAKVSFLDFYKPIFLIPFKL